MPVSSHLQTTMNENSPPYVFEKQNDLEKISSDLATITVSYMSVSLIFFHFNFPPHNLEKTTERPTKCNHWQKD